MTGKLKNLDIGLGAILISLYFIALPLTIATDSAGNSYLKIMTIPIAAYLAVSLLFYKGKIKLNSVHFFSALFLISVVVTLFVDNSGEAISYVFGYIETIALMFLMTMREYSKDEIEAFEVSQLILLVILICLGLSGSEWSGGRNTITIFGAASDPNYFTGLFLLPIVVALKKLRENKLYMTVCPILIILGVYIILSSGSRGGLLGLAVTIISFVFFYTKGAKQKLIGLGMAAAAAVILWTIIIPLLPESVAARFTVAEVVASGGTHRVDIWISMLDTIKNSTWQLFCGRGISVSHEMLLEGRLEHVVAHNQFIQLLYSQGLFGFVGFVLMSLAAILRNSKERPYISAAMLGTLALAMSLSINPSFKSFWNVFTYSAFAFNMTRNQEEAGTI